MRLLLIRHGQTPSNVGMLLDTAVPGADLNETGQAQAEGVATALANVPVDLIVTSNLVRTQQTAAPLAAARELEPWIRPGVREISAGHLEMRGDRDSLLAFSKHVSQWEKDLNYRFPGGETGTEVLTRFNKVIGEVHDTVGSKGTVALFSHGAMLRMFVAAHVNGMSLAAMKRTSLDNTSLIELRGNPREWNLIQWGEKPLGDLPPLVS